MTDIPHETGDDRYAIYAASREGTYRRRIAETSRDGLGAALVTLADEGEFLGYRIGIFDRHRRLWIVNPF
jgi:hypothetical protein